MIKFKFGAAGTLLFANTGATYRQRLHINHGNNRSSNHHVVAS